MDFSPAPAPAPALRRIWRHGRTEAVLLMRNGEQLLLALVIPLALLVGGHYLGHHVGLGGLQVLAPSVLTLAIVSTAFTSVAISTGFERRYGVLERLSATPLQRSGLILGKTLSLLIVLTGQLLVLASVAVVLGWRPVGGLRPTLIALIAVVLAITTFAAWALVLAGTVRAEVTLGLANLIYLALLAGGATMVPVSDHPAGMQPVLQLLPTAALGECLRGWSLGQTHPLPLVVLAVWGTAGVLLARKALKWSS